MVKWGDKPYYSMDYYLKNTFGSKTYKITLDAGFTCPNRDGRISKGGCIFCSAGGSGEFAGDRNKPISKQLEEGIEGLKKFHANQYIAYYQAFTNTYADADYLRRVYRPSFEHPLVAAVSIATRPDCISSETMQVFDEMRVMKPLWVELGLQTIHEKTAEYINRGYKLECFENTVNMLKRAGIAVIVHVIIGLPQETTEDMLETIKYLNRLKVDGVKLQLLHVIENTVLAQDYAEGKFEVLSLDEYVEIILKCISYLSPDIVIHRLTGDGPSDMLKAPLWSREKLKVLNKIHHELKERGIYQGCALE